MSKEQQEQPKPSYEDLVRENEQLRRRVTELERLVEQLRRELEEARRWQKRQAAPFSRGEPKAQPKRPGRAVGHPAAHRPRPERIDRVIAVPLGIVHCPECGDRLGTPTIEHQYQIDIPRVEPIVTQFDIEVAGCPGCGCRVQARHEEQTSDALGAAAVQIGPNALALATEMKHWLGVSYGKLRAFFWSVFHMVISRACFARADQRIGRKLAPTYEVLKIELRGCAYVNADETGWKIGGCGAWLWVFTEVAITVYVIDTSRGHEVIEAVLGPDFAGTLGCDGFLAYDAVDYNQQKCLSHILHRCSEIEAVKSRGAVRFSRRVAALLRAAMRLKERRARLTEHGYRVACGRLEAALDRLLESHLTDPDNAKLARHLKKHRASLLRFLYEEVVEATNNRAERALRPAVISRKLSAGNRSDRGAEAHAIIASVAQTCHQQGKDFIEGVKDVLRSRTPRVLSLAGAAPSDT